jgi:hypothetical protein
VAESLPFEFRSKKLQCIGSGGLHIEQREFYSSLRWRLLLFADEHTWDVIIAIWDDGFLE